MPNSADKSPDPEGTLNTMSDPELDDLGFAMPEFRVPSRSSGEDTPENANDGSSDDGVVDDGVVDDGVVDEATHSVSVDSLLEEDQAAAEQPAFDRAELVRTVRMDAFDRRAVEGTDAVASWEVTGYLDDQRYAPDVLIYPPRVLTKKWQDGASARPNGAAGPDRALAETVRTQVPDSSTTDGGSTTVDSDAESLDLDSEAIEVENVPLRSNSPPPQPAPAGIPKQRPNRVRRNTGPLQTAAPTPSPQSESDDDDLSGIVQELLEEKKAKAEPKKRPKRDEKRINWFADVFSEEYFRTLPKDLHKETDRDVRFIRNSLGLQKGARVLDLACGFGRHAVELAQRDYEVAGLDVSMAMLQRALSEAQRRGLSIKFVHGDMRELSFSGIFDACFCWQTSFGYFDDRTNVQVAQGVARALKPGGRFLVDVVNRDHVVSEMPSRTWWEGHECVFLEEVEFDNHFSVLHTKRSFIYEDGSPPREFSSYIRLYSLHELRQLLHFAGFRVIEISGSVHHQGSFLGPASPRLIILAEKVVKDS